MSVAKYRAKFSELEASACAYAVAVPYSLERLDTWVDNTYATKLDARGLAKPIPVMDSKPTFDVEEVRSYFEEGLKLHTWGATLKLHDASTGSTDASADASADGSAATCKVFEIHVATQMQTAYQARFVYTPGARNHDEVGRFHNYADGHVRSVAGFNSGYSRWMDEHWAFELRDDFVLDQIRFHLEASDTPYHAHVTEVFGSTTAGSLWAWGVSGMAIEWHGNIDYTTLHKPIGGFDFCTADTVCQAQDKTCIEVANLTTTSSNDDGDDDKDDDDYVAGATGVHGLPGAAFGETTDAAGRTVTVGDEGEDPQ